MQVLPNSVEAALKDAGLSKTELLVIRHLVRGHHCTLRELAARTGKSTGVLDQATKKLVMKGIVVREQINDRSKYTIQTPSSIAQWIERHAQEKQQQEQRRIQDIGSFMANIELELSRPRMEYFEGEDGFRQILLRILEAADGTIYHYASSIQIESADPLLPIRKQWNRVRRHQKVALQVIAPNTPIGRHYAERDVLEQRQTVLVPGDQFALTVEQYIAGNCVVCCNMDTLHCSLIQFSEYAQDQTKLFTALYNSAKV